MVNVTRRGPQRGKIPCDMAPSLAMEYQNHVAYTTMATPYDEAPSLAMEYVDLAAIVNWRGYVQIIIYSKK